MHSFILVGLLYQPQRHDGANVFAHSRDRSLVEPAPEETSHFMVGRFGMACDFALHSSAAFAYGKRRRHHTSAGRLKSMLSETEVGVAVGYNVERPV